MNNKRNSRQDNYVYILLNPLKPGFWEFEDKVFDFQPFYVGRGVDDRKNNHTLPSRLKVRSHKNATILQIKNSGKKVIIEELFSSLDYNTSENIEIKMIKHFGRCDLGTGILTNLTDGGLIPRNYVKRRGERGFRSDSKRVDQFDLNGNFLRKWDWAISAAKEFGISADCIQECCAGKKRTYKGFIWKYDGTCPAAPKVDLDPLSKEVFQYKNGFYCQSFPSIREASRITGVYRNNISDCCNNTAKTAGNFQWFFEFQGEVLPKTPKILKKGDRRRLFKLDKDLNIIQDYSSMKEASVELNVDRIKKRFLNDQTKVFRGYSWCYADDFAIKYPDLMEKYEQSLRLLFQDKIAA